MNAAIHNLRILQTSSQQASYSGYKALNTSLMVWKLKYAKKKNKFPKTIHDTLPHVETNDMSSFVVQS